MRKRLFCGTRSINLQHMVPKPAISRTCLAALTHVAMLGPRAGDAYAQASGPSWPELARLQRALQQYRQIAINLERSRQVFTAARGDFLLVNIPAFEASLVRDGNTVWTTRVVVGEVGGRDPGTRSAAGNRPDAVDSAHRAITDRRHLPDSAGR